ncbi:site-specific integrase, partial [Sporosarcina psychrophila]
MINKEGVWVLDSTKTASSERDIHIGQTLVNILKKHRIWLIKNKLKYGAHYTESDHVCVKECGSIITPSVIKYNTRKMQ